MLHRPHSISLMPPLVTRPELLLIGMERILKTSIRANRILQSDDDRLAMDVPVGGDDLQPGSAVGQFVRHLQLRPPGLHRRLTTISHLSGVRVQHLLAAVRIASQGKIAAAWEKSAELIVLGVTLRQVDDRATHVADRQVRVTSGNRACDHGNAVFVAQHDVAIDAIDFLALRRKFVPILFG